MLRRGLKFILMLAAVVTAIVIFSRVELIHRGGPVMVPMLLISIFAFALIMDKMKQLSDNRIEADRFLGRIVEQIERQRIKEAIDLCDQVTSPVSRVLKAGILKYDRPKDDIREAMEDSLSEEFAVFEENMTPLSTIIQIAPLLGFAGTLLGLAKILLVIQSKSASSLAVSPLDLVPGIWEALVCSMAGFMVALPVLLVYNYLVRRIKSLADETQRSASQLLTFLLERRMAL